MELLLKITYSLTMAALLTACASGNLMITEIMYNPPGTDAHREWIEIYNNGGETNISEWSLLEDGVSHQLSVIETQPAPYNNEILQPGEYAVIAEDAGQFLGEHPGYSGTLVDTSWNSLSNTGETLALQTNGETKSSLSYSPSWGGDGNNRTLEKKNPDGGDDAGNWGESATPGGTPGNENIPSNSEPSATSTTTTTTSTTTTTTTTSTTTIACTTSTTTTSTTTTTTTGMTSTTTTSTTTMACTTSTTTSAMTSTTSTTTTTTTSTTTVHTTPATSTTTATSATTSATSTTTTTARTTSTSTSTTIPGTGISSLRSSTTTSTTLPADELTITINELMYNPGSKQGPDDILEYVELYNYGSDAIDLKGWVLMDSGSDAEVLAGFNNTTTVLPPRGCAVVTDEDSNVTLLPGSIRLSTGDGSICTSGLSNAGERLILYDPYGREIDSIEYLPSWGGNGNNMSLEKRQPEEENEQYNWGESLISGGTPGERNSIYGQASESVTTTRASTTTTTIEACSDGTLLGECSANKPKYCFDGILVLRCSKCGCPRNYDCMKDECVKKTNQTVVTEEYAETTEGQQAQTGAEETRPEEHAETSRPAVDTAPSTTEALRREETPAVTTPASAEETRETQNLLAGYPILSKAANPKAAGTITLSLLFGFYLLRRRKNNGVKKQEDEL